MNREKKMDIRRHTSTALLAAVLITLAVSTSMAQRAGSTRLTGTYVLDADKSDRVADIIRFTGDLTAAQEQELESMLYAEDAVAIEVRSGTVAIGRPDSNPSTLSTDGRTSPDTRFGKSVRVRASVRGDQLTVTILQGTTEVTTVYALDRTNVEMKVSRRVTAEYLRDTVDVDSYYKRTEDVARFKTAAPAEEGYSSNDPSDIPSGNRRPATSQKRPGTFYVTSGEILTGTLENDIITGVTQDNDRFRIMVIAPGQYKGAVISGYVTGVTRSGRVSGRPEVVFNFETIRLANGRTYDFGGFLTNVTDTDGKVIKTDAEGAAKGDSQTRDTARRSGIGAGIGAVIGGILGGGKGAVVGAVIGGGAGAGSVIAQGKDDLKLLKGTSVSVQASSPR